jgi:hypothetical protein
MNFVISKRIVGPDGGENVGSEDTLDTTTILPEEFLLFALLRLAINEEYEAHTFFNSQVNLFFCNR